MASTKLSSAVVMEKCHRMPATASIRSTNQQTDPHHTLQLMNCAAIIILSVYSCFVWRIHALATISF